MRAAKLGCDRDKRGGDAAIDGCDRDAWQPKTAADGDTERAGAKGRGDAWQPKMAADGDTEGADAKGTRGRLAAIYKDIVWLSLQPLCL